MKERKLRSISIAALATIIISLPFAGILYSYFYLPPWIFMAIAIGIFSSLVFARIYNKRRKEARYEN